MAPHNLKNNLRTLRKKIGLSQRQVAAILGVKSMSRVSDLEAGKLMPTTRDCVAFQLLFKRPLEHIWPALHFELEAGTDLNVRKLIDRLVKHPTRSERRTAKLVSKRLGVIVDGLPEDIADVI